MKRLTLLSVIFLLTLTIVPSAAQDGADIADFVYRRNSLSDEEIRSYTHNWGRDEFWQYYYHRAVELGEKDPAAIADRLIAEDLRMMEGDLTQYYGRVIPRTHYWLNPSRNGEYWISTQRDCDNDSDWDYSFHFGNAPGYYEHYWWYSTDWRIGIDIGGVSGYLNTWSNDQWTRVCVGDSRVCSLVGDDNCWVGANKIVNAMKLQN